MTLLYLMVTRFIWLIRLQLHPPGGTAVRLIIVSVQVVRVQHQHGWTALIRWHDGRANLPKHDSVRPAAFLKPLGWWQ
jgi:hypothetical protein